MKKRNLCAGLIFAVSLNIYLGAATAFAQTAVKSPAGHFEFHIDPWISLHHFTYHFVREEERNLKLRGRVPLTEEDRSALSVEFRSACAALVPAYRPYIEGSLLFDTKTRGLTRTLTEGPEALADMAVREALTKCMPAYEKVLWKRHRFAGERLLKHLTEQLLLHETAMAKRLASSLEGTWPDTPIRVDLSPYANWAGAYTDDSPANITMSSLDKEIAGTYAFEILFHESGHTVSFGQSLLSAASSALEATELESDRFWHYVLFFVVGHATAEVLDDPDYMPFSEAAGLTKSENAKDYYEALNHTWGSGGSFHERILRAARMVSDNRQ